uniref:Helicase-like transcription factor CHR28 n=1 Tax=Musa acuminata subsp. malaccensis TaxID=214687 RepID=A0A804KLE7_MUSAM|nr:PREDICTED: helicase-like transcription factor CHR28 isoform X1 [Musa acuminata subsp. malaccensis]
MAVAPGNSSDNLGDNDALLLDDNLSISVEGLYAFLDEQPFDPVDDQSQITFEGSDRGKQSGGPTDPVNAFQPNAGFSKSSAHGEFNETLASQWTTSNFLGVSDCKKETNLGFSFGSEQSSNSPLIPVSGHTSAVSAHADSKSMFAYPLSRFGFSNQEYDFSSMNLVGSSRDSLISSNFNSQQLQYLSNCPFGNAEEAGLDVSHYVDFGCDLYSDSDQKDFDELRAGISQQNRFKMYESYADDSLNTMTREEKTGLTDCKLYDDRNAALKNSLEEKCLYTNSSMDVDSTFLKSIISKLNATEATNMVYNAHGNCCVPYRESPTDGVLRGLRNTVQGQFPHLIVSHQKDVIKQIYNENEDHLYPFQSSTRSSAVELDKALASVGSLIQMADTDEPLPDICVEQNYLDDVSLKSESSIDSSPLPSTRNSIFDNIPAIDASLKWFPHSYPNLHNKRQKTSTNTGREELVQEFHYIQHNSLKHSDDDVLNVSSTVSCISVDDDDADICILDDVSNFAHPLAPTVIIKNQTMLEQSGYIQTYQPRLGGTRLKADDERLTLWLELQDLSQQRSEAILPDEGMMSVSLLRHQRIALFWMVQKETASPHCSGGILADDQGLGKTISTIALILMERSPSHQPLSCMGKQDRPESLHLDDDDDCGDFSEINGVKKPQISGLMVDSGSKKREYPVMAVSSRPAAGTLIVCPTSVLRQWAEELKTRVTSSANLSFLVYHGNNRTKDPHELTKYDVVLTTYAIVSMEVPKQPLVGEVDEEKRKHDSLIRHMADKKRKGSPSSSKKCMKNGIETQSALLKSSVRPLARVWWFRVILDEAQSIKNHRTQVARACWGLRAKRRWCLSGTPIQNAVDDLYSYFRFLGYQPYADYGSFCSMIKNTISRNPKNGYKKLQAVLKTIMLRRTKGTMINGEPIITLPPKIVTLKKVDFSEGERAFYTNLEAESREQFKVYANEGTVKENYVNILLMLLRLRQACDHRLLVNGCSSNSVKSSSIEMVKKLPEGKQNHLLSCLEAGLAICTICNDPPEDAVVTVCGHVFCNQCICEHLDGDDNICPSADCKVRLNVSSVFSKITLVSSIRDLPGNSCSSSGCSSKMVDAVKISGNRSSSYSSKVKAAIEILQSLPKSQCSLPNCNYEKSNGETDGSLQHGVTVSQRCSVHTNDGKNFDLKCQPSEKAIVFSQWTRMLDLLEVPLKDSCIQYRRLDGTMSIAAREKAIKDFNMLPEVTVMIMSLKAASLGLNLVVACHVLLLDLWWNPTTEDQAIDRAHRIGQTRPVTVSRLMVRNTVEDRILALQEKKREMVASAFGEDESGTRQTRLTVEDLNYLFNV